MDYLLCSRDLIHVLNKNALFWGPLSDHKYLIAENSEKTTAKTGPGIWRHNDSHLNNNEYCTVIAEAIDRAEHTTRNVTPSVRWDMIKQGIKEASMKYSKNKAREETQEIDEANNTLLNENNKPKEEVITARNKLADWAERKAKRVIFKAQADHEILLC